MACHICMQCSAHADLSHVNVQVLDRRWFHGKHCMDIGCNEGVITLAAVQRFAPLSMLGVDIDAGLIKAACRQAVLGLMQ